MLRAAVATLLLLFVAGCSDEDAVGAPQANANVGDEGLTVTRDGGSTYELHDAVAECIKSDAGIGDTDVVRLTAPADYHNAFRKDKLVDPFLYVEVIPGVKGRREFPLKMRNDDEGPSDVVVFGGDPEGQNQLSGSEEVSTGHIVIIEATCDPEPRVEFTIRATLGSAFSDGRSIHVLGRIDSGDPPR